MRSPSQGRRQAGRGRSRPELATTAKLAALATAGLLVCLIPARASAHKAAPPPVPGDAPEAGTAHHAASNALAVPAALAGDDGAADAEVDAGNDSPGYTPPPVTSSAVELHGYVDMGVAKASGDGTSFAPGDTRIPADYGVDTFATAVNSRGDVASTDAGQNFVNGFLPRSVGIGGHGAALLNTANLDFRYQAPSAPLMVFVRAQLLPRFTGDGDGTRVYLEQAFGRITPFESSELALSIGRFDSVFGIEYLDNQANIRTGVTPSLAARYTTGQGLGAKLFYRVQLAPLWSAVSLNASATNGSTFVEALQPVDASLTGTPVLSARLGYELNLSAVQMKLGASVLRGPRNDQASPDAMLSIMGLDARLFLGGLALSGEYVHVNEDEGATPKTTSQGTFAFASSFWARAYWLQAAYALSIDAGPLHKVTPYGRYGHRHAWFGGFVPITVDRITLGLRIDLWDSVIVKGEVLLNRELEGAPNVDNNVYTSSLVYQW